MKGLAHDTHGNTHHPQVFALWAGHASDATAGMTRLSKGTNPTPNPTPDPTPNPTPKP